MRLLLAVFFLLASVFASSMEFRKIDGSMNNSKNPKWGKAGETFARRVKPAYSDGVSRPARLNEKSPREISNIVLDQKESFLNKRRLTDLFWTWGQFLDHDITLTQGAEEEKLFIPVPCGDPIFDPNETCNSFLSFFRSDFVMKRHSRLRKAFRRQINNLSSFIDGSNIYGSSVSRLKALRTNDGTGRLKFSSGRFLPFNDKLKLPNEEPIPGRRYYVAGDVRANEQLTLLALHTLWMREHNYLANKIRKESPHLSGDEVFYRARAIVGALLQKITYDEWLPALMGSIKIPKYKGYNSELNPSISNLFATVAFRFGHSMIAKNLLRLNNKLKKIPQGHVLLKESFFNPGLIKEGGGITPLINGAVVRHAQEVDIKINDSLRNFLFFDVPSVNSGRGTDLASLNIQRGRDHGLPSFNSLRKSFGLKPYSNYMEMTRSKSVAKSLQKAYSNINNVDPWVGVLAEKKVKGSGLGELMGKIFVDQFVRLRDGDRFWYQNYFKGKILDWIEGQTLTAIIRRNTKSSIPKDWSVFRKPKKRSR